MKPSKSPFIIFFLMLKQSLPNFKLCCPSTTSWLSKKSTRRQQRIHYRVIKSYISYETSCTSGKKTTFLLSIRFALFLRFTRKQAAPRQWKKSFFHCTRLALFLYRLKWGVFNCYWLSGTYIITKEFHMDLNFGK